MESDEGKKGVLGIHHVTAVARNPQENIDFYSGILGLKLVKLTVNFDDPTTYHLYYGDSTGKPGTILTFFPWSDAQKGYSGNGQVTAISFLIPPESIKYWSSRLDTNDILFTGPSKRFGNEEFISFHDPDGLKIEMVPSSNFISDIKKQEVAWDKRKEGPVPAEHAIIGFHSVTLSEERYEHTASLLINILGFGLVAKDNNEGRFRFKINNRYRKKTIQEIGTIVDIVCQPDISRGVVGIGTVHHVAWRVLDGKHQVDLCQRIVKEAYLNPTPIIDRKYFYSVYFREPGGILFEIATDPPGFAVDERPEELGKHLVLPEWLEPMREKLEQVLPAINPRKDTIAGDKGCL